MIDWHAGPEEPPLANFWAISIMSDKKRCCGSRACTRIGLPSARACLSISFARFAQEKYVELWPWCPKIAESKALSPAWKRRTRCRQTWNG